MSRGGCWTARLREGNSKVFAAYLGGRVNSHEIAELRLGKKAEAAYERAGELTRALDRYAYHVDVRFDDSDVDQARAAGVVIEFERSSPIIVDRSLYRELVKAAITRTVAELEAKVAARAARSARPPARARRAAARPPTRPRRPSASTVSACARSPTRRTASTSTSAPGCSTGLSTVDPADLDVARFFVYSLLGSDYDDSPYTQQGERVARLAVSGIRLVIEEFRADVTKTRKDGSKGALRIDYGNGREPKEPVRWLWKYIDGAKTAGELYGRALVVIAAEQYATRLVVPQSQRAPATRWSSHKDLAAKALTKLAGPHLPASLRQLETAVKRATRSTTAPSQRARAAAQRASRREAAAAGDAAAADAPDVEAEVDDDEVDVEVEEADEAEQ